MEQGNTMMRGLLSGDIRNVERRDMERIVNIMADEVESVLNEMPAHKNQELRLTILDMGIYNFTDNWIQDKLNNAFSDWQEYFELTIQVATRQNKSAKDTYTMYISVKEKIKYSDWRKWLDAMYKPSNDAEDGLDRGAAEAIISRVNDIAHISPQIDAGHGSITRGRREGPYTGTLRGMNALPELDMGALQDVLNRRVNAPRQTRAPHQMYMRNDVNSTLRTNAEEQQDMHRRYMDWATGRRR